MVTLRERERQRQRQRETERDRDRERQRETERQRQRETERQKKQESCKWKGNRCQVCLNVSETETFTSTVTHMSCKFNHCFHCNDKCLIYLLACKTCLNQCIGSTTDCFRYLWNSLEQLQM